MHEYDQKEKEISRKKFWKKAITSLTNNRESSCVITDDNIQNAIDWLEDNHGDDIERDVFDNLRSIASQAYDYKFKNIRDLKRDELKIAYFSGPNPIGDLKHLLKYGVDPRNIWAFEVEPATFNCAINELKMAGLQINVYRGKIEDFASTIGLKFDIAYLDYTGSLLSKNVLDSLITLLDEQFLSDLSVLGVNTCYPDNNDENIALISSFLFPRPWIEAKYIQDSEFIESCQSYGVETLEKFSTLVKNNFESAYSTYSIHYIASLCSTVIPSLRMLRQPFAKKLLLKNDAMTICKDIYSKLKTEESDLGLIHDCTYPDLSYLHYLSSSSQAAVKNSPTFKAIFENRPGKISLEDALIASSILKDIEQWQVSVKKKLRPGKQKESEPGHIKTRSFEILSDEFVALLGEINSRIKLNAIPSVDIPMNHLWTQLATAKLSNPIHVNERKTKRYSYTAKIRKMNLDVFVLDRCRYFYDSIATPHLWGDDFEMLEMQIFNRLCIDIIHKKQFYLQPHTFNYGNLVANYEIKRLKTKYPPVRIEIKAK